MSIIAVSRGGCLGHFADLAYLTRASYGAMSLPGFVVPYYASIHTWGTLSMAPAEDKRDVKATKSKSNEHGSVLMEIIKSQDQQPKQLTVGSKGMPKCKLQCYCISTFKKQTNYF